MWFPTVRLQDLSDWRRGVDYLVRAWRILLDTPALRAWVIALTLVQVVIFVFCILGVGLLVEWGLSTWVFENTPDRWWLTVLYVVAILAALLAALFIASSVFLAISMVLAAPLYELFAQKVVKTLRLSLGESNERPWWHQTWGAIVNASTKLVWLFVIQVLLLGLYLVPFAFGPVAYVVSGLLVTTLFHAIEYLDWSFDHRGWSFKKRLAWCMKRKGLVFGFGLGVFAASCVPVVNVLLPAVALTGSLLLFTDEEKKRSPRSLTKKTRTS